jgi:hypothetical protein
MRAMSESKGLPSGSFLLIADQKSVYLSSSKKLSGHFIFSFLRAIPAAATPSQVDTGEQMRIFQKCSSVCVHSDVISPKN